jgi:hypothetical protein
MGGAYLQNCLGGLRVGCGGATWRIAIGRLTQALTWLLTPAVDRRPWTAEGVRPLF